LCLKNIFKANSVGTENNMTTGKQIQNNEKYLDISKFLRSNGCVEALGTTSLTPFASADPFSTLCSSFPPETGVLLVNSSSKICWIVLFGCNNSKKEII